MPDSVMTMEAPTFGNRSAEIKDLAMALSKAQAMMTGATKDANNPHFNRKYADLASVWDAVRKPLTDNDIAVVQFPRAANQGVEIETTLVHGKTGQYMRDVLWVPCSKNDAQGLGSAITYGRRYALMAVTGIAPVEDDDGNAAVATYKPAPGTAGAGGQFRPERRSPGMAQTESLKVDPADRDMVQGDGRSQYEADKAKKAAAKTGPLGGREATPEEARKLKIKNAVDKRVAFLKETKWTRDSLNQFWTDNEEWIDWMTDPNNKAMEEYDRFSKAYADAEVNLPAAEAA